MLVRLLAWLPLLARSPASKIKISVIRHASSRRDSRSHATTRDQEEDEPQAHDR
jgi:hypothetical protein